MLFVASSHLLLVCFLLHTSFIGDGGYVGCLDQLLPPATASYNLQDEQLRLLRIQILPDAEAADWSLVTGSINSHSSRNTSFNGPEALDPGLGFVYAPQKSLFALLEHADALQTDVRMDTLYLPMSARCFELRWFDELPLWTLIRDRVVGYDTILVNQLIRQYGARGFFYREDSRVVVDMSYGVFNPAAAAQSVRVCGYFSMVCEGAVSVLTGVLGQWLRFVAMKFKILHTILFLFFVFTALVAFVLIETQKRMITFAALFQNRQQLQIPFANLVVTFFAQSLMFVPVMVRMLLLLFDVSASKKIFNGGCCAGWHAVFPVRAVQRSTACVRRHDGDVGGRIVLCRERANSTVASVLPTAVLLPLHALPRLPLLVPVRLLVHRAGCHESSSAATHALLLELLRDTGPEPRRDLKSVSTGTIISLISPLELFSRPVMSLDWLPYIT